MSVIGPITGDPGAPNSPGLGQPSGSCPTTAPSTGDRIAQSRGSIPPPPRDSTPGSVQSDCTHGCEGPTALGALTYGFPGTGGALGSQCCGDSDGSGDGLPDRLAQGTVSGGGGSQCCTPTPTSTPTPTPTPTPIPVGGRTPVLFAGSPAERPPYRRSLRGISETASPLDRAAAAVDVVRGRTTAPAIAAGGCAVMGIGCQVSLASGNLAVRAAPPNAGSMGSNPVLTYNSQVSTSGELGNGWSSNFQRHIDGLNSNPTVITGAGQSYSYTLLAPPTSPQTARSTR